MQRFVWDLTYPNPPADYDLPISAIYKDTPFVPLGPAVSPGLYTVTLIADGKSFNQGLTIRMDPRVKTPPLGLKKQFDLSMLSYDGIARVNEITAAIEKFSANIAKARATANTDAQKTRLDMIETKIKLLMSGPQRRPGEPSPVAEIPLSRLGGAFAQLLDLLQDADVAPSTQAVAASNDLQTALAKSETSWKEITNMMTPK